jgi:hypothetical protein
MSPETLKSSWVMAFIHSSDSCASSSLYLLFICNLKNVHIYIQRLKLIRNTYRKLVHSSQKIVKVIIMQNTKAKCMKLMQMESPWKSQQDQLIKKFPALYGTRRFITVFT